MKSVKGSLETGSMGMVGEERTNEGVCDGRRKELSGVGCEGNW